jgi:hypothetical protein
VYRIGVSLFFIASFIAGYIKVKTGSYDFIYILINLSTLFEFVAPVYIIYCLLDTEVFKKIIRISTPIIILFSLGYYTWFGWVSLYTLPMMLSFFVLMVYLIFYFYEKVRTVTNYPLSQTISFWICVGFFIFITGSFFFPIIFNTSDINSIQENIRIIYSVMTIIKAIIFCIALFATEPTKGIEELQIPDNLLLDDFTPENLKTPS